MKNVLFIVLLASAGFLGSFFLFGRIARGANADIVINEIGAYEPSGHEWVEILNKGSAAVDMTGWEFWESDPNHGLSLVQGDDLVIGPGEYAVIVQNDANFRADYPNVTTTIFDSSWGTINESGEEIRIEDADGNFVEQFTYVAASNFSLERKDPSSVDYSANNWQEHPSGNTVGARNYWAVGDGGGGGNQPPTAMISGNATATANSPVVFDGSASRDNDGTVASYAWTVDGVSVGSSSSVMHTFTNAGVFAVVLTVTDDDGTTDSETLNVTVTSDGAGAGIPRVVINEFVSDPVSGEKEWIELYNASTSNVDLTGWTLADGVGTIASPTSTIGALGFFVIELSSSKLNNDGDVIILKNPSGTTIDQVRYGNWTDETDANTSDNATAVSDPNAVARLVNGQDTGNDKNDFAETTTPTKGASNVITTPAASAPAPSSGGGGGGSVPLPTFDAGIVVINELASDPADGAEEFIELYNKSGGPIALDNWWMEDGSETKTTLSGSIPSKGFFVVASPKGNLNNAGDIIILFDPSGKEIDRATYGTWDDGNVADNAAMAEDPLSLARKVDGQDANNDYYDFAVTATVTKGRANVISGAAPDGSAVTAPSGSASVILNEVLPNPAGSDTEDEFIELKNVGSVTVDVSGWKIGDASAGRYTVIQGSVAPNGFFVFKRSMTGIALNNTGGDEVKLFGQNGTLVDSVKYAGSAREGESYARRTDGAWAWTLKPTPGKDNIVEGKSAAPVIAIDADTEVAAGEPGLFDASDTTDPEGDAMVFSWDFGDGVSDDGDVAEHRFITEGIYTVHVTVTDASGNESKKSVVVTVKSASAFTSGHLSTDEVARVRISEFVPNPEGSDATEFIELHNPAGEPVDLSGLKLDDEEGGSRAYMTPDGTVIEAGEYKVFGRQDTKLALNNTSDAVRLLYPDGTIIAEVAYDDVPEGAAYVQNDVGTWMWTQTLTPGEANVVAVVRSKTVARTTASRSRRVAPLIETTLEKLRDEDIGDRVKVTGIVAVLPGVLGSQYFYIVGSPGVQIYSYKKDFSKFVIGDRIEVTGEISEAYGETRVKTTQASDMRVIDHPGEPEPTPVDIADVGEPFEGWLAKIHGEITEIKTSYMYVDDGTEEIKVYFKRGAGIDRKLFVAGDLVEVTGIVSQTRDGYQLLPRGQEDIVKTGVAESAVISMEQQEISNERDVAEKYLTATAGGLTSILLGLFAKARGKMLAGLLKRGGVIAIAFLKKK